LAPCGLLIDQRLIDARWSWPLSATGWGELAGLVPAFAAAVTRVADELTGAGQGAAHSSDLEDDLARQSELLTFLNLRFRPPSRFRRGGGAVLSRTNRSAGSAGRSASGIELRIATERADQELEVWLAISVSVHESFSWIGTFNEEIIRIAVWLAARSRCWRDNRHRSPQRLAGGQDPSEVIRRIATAPVAASSYPRSVTTGARSTWNWRPHDSWPRAAGNGAPGDNRSFAGTPAHYFVSPRDIDVTGVEATRPKIHFMILADGTTNLRNAPRFHMRRQKIAGVEVARFIAAMLVLAESAGSLSGLSLEPAR